MSDTARTIYPARSRPRSLIARLALFLFVVLTLTAISILASVVRKQQQRIESLEFQNRLEDIVQRSETASIVRLDRLFADSAELDLSSKTYASLVTDNGIFYVKVESAEPYLDGYKIHLMIGNPLSARYSEVKLKARWGHASHYDPNDLDKTQWENSLRKQEYPLREDLTPGSWTTTEIILPTTPAEETGYLEVSLETPNVFLIKN